MHFASTWESLSIKIVFNKSTKELLLKRNKPLTGINIAVPPFQQSDNKNTHFQTLPDPQQTTGNRQTEETVTTHVHGSG